MNYYSDLKSSLISNVEYDDESKELTLNFVKYYVDTLTYYGVPFSYFEELCNARSAGKFYLEMIKPQFSTKQKQNKMADLIIKCKINVQDVIRDWFFNGEKGVYLNFTILFNHQQDKYKTNGPIIQDVPTKIYEDEKKRNVPKANQTKGPILGNCMVFQNGPVNEESRPGVESGKMAGDGGGIAEDLPF